MAPAHRDVLVVGAELDLGAVDDGLAALQAQVERGFLLAELAGDLDLFDAVGELEQALGAGEEVGLEVGAQAVADDRDARVDGEGGAAGR